VLKDDYEGEEDEDEPKNLYAYLIKNGLINRTKRKRGDPIESMITRRDFGHKPKAEVIAVKAKPIAKFKEIK